MNGSVEKPRTEIEEVVANWIEQATSSFGQLADGVDPAKWAADNFVAWWRARAEDSLGSAEMAARCLRDELSRLGDTNRLGEAFHELTHLDDALSELRADLGCTRTDKDEV